MKKRLFFIFKLLIYYLVGLVSFSIIAYTTQTVLLAVLMETVIDPIQDFYNIKNILLAFAPYYLSFYTILYVLLLYMIRMYDKHTVNILNQKLVMVKGDDRNGKR